MQPSEEKMMKPFHNVCSVKQDSIYVVIKLECGKTVVITCMSDSDARKITDTFITGIEIT